MPATQVRHEPNNGRAPQSALEVEPSEPALREEAITLLDGSVVWVRAIQPEDSERLRAFHARLSPETVRQRFFHCMPQLTARMAEHFTHVDQRNRAALVATRGSGASEEIVGVVSYDRIGPATAEAAFVVADRWQGHGIATALLQRLAAFALACGFTTLVAITMAGNVRMLHVLRRAGFPLTMSVHSGEIEAQLDITHHQAGVRDARAVH
jgi:RimJ/RimL family protein N-acetyltransferase